MPNGGNRAIRPAERTSSPRSELNGDCADRPDSGGRISMSFSPVVMTLDGISHPFLNAKSVKPPCAVVVPQAQRERLRFSWHMS